MVWTFTSSWKKTPTRARRCRSRCTTCPARSRRWNCGGSRESRRELELGTLAVHGADVRLDPAADLEVSDHLDPARMRRRHEVVEDPVGDVFVERAFLPIRPQ